MLSPTNHTMTERYEWVEIVEPRTQDHMYANLTTGECSWHPPPGVKIKKTCENDNQWWELYDANTSRFYYYNAANQKTVWQRPQHCDIIPLAKLQNPKPLSEEAKEDEAEKRPLVQKEMSTQTPVKKENHGTSTSSLNRTQTSPLQSQRHRHTKTSRTVRGEKSSKEVPKGRGASESGHLDGNAKESERNQKTSFREESYRLNQTDSKTPRAKRTEEIPVGSYEGESKRANDFSRMQRMEGHLKGGGAGSLPDGVLRIPRPYTTSRTGNSDGVQRVTPKVDSTDVLFSPRLHPSRRVESQRTPSSPSGFLLKEPPAAQPQRSLELPKHLPLAPVAPDVQLARVASARPGDLKKVGMDMSWTSTGDPKFAVGRGPTNNYHASCFQRQDSFPTMRESSRSNAWQQAASGQYQDVSQITAVQVTPRPKPRAFPRTNPSYVGMQRSDGVGSSYRKVTEINHQWMPPAADFGHQAYYYPNKDRLSGSYAGAKTLQASHMHYKDSASAAKAERSIFKNEDYDSDTSQSSTSSELSDLHQYTLDSKVARPHPTNKLISSLHRPSTGHRPTGLQGGGTIAADREVAAMMSSSLSPGSSPSFHGNKVRSNGGYGVVPEGPREQPVRVDLPKKEIRLTHQRRNSEPDYVNVPPGSEHRGPSSISQTMRSHGGAQKTTTTAVTPDLEDEEGERSGGTLRIRDHASPSNFPDNNYEGSSDRSSALSTPSPQSHPRQSHLSSETHHPSLRRRKWLDKPTQQVRQSTLEKSLSLQAELAQHRPLSMIVPFGSDSNAIVSQVADSLLQQMDIERFVTENLNEHRKGLLGKAVPVSNMLVWTKDIIQKPMIRTENKVVKRDAPEVFKLIQLYMGDRKSKDHHPPAVALDLLNKGWSCQELADEIFMQLCRQTTKNPRDESLLAGWELLGICLSFFSPSPKFQSYLDGHIFRALDSRDHTAEGRIHNYAICCHRRLDRISQAGSKRKPSLEEIEHSKKSLLEPSMFGGTLESIMDLQKHRYANSKLPWIQTTLSQELLRLSPSQLTEGIFRVPGDTDEVNALKARCDQWIPPTDCTDPHILASLLKLWYRELYEPLIPHDFYERCVDSYADADGALKIVAELPEMNRLVLSYLVLFLQKFALPETAAVTKMDANNLAMVMAPNCLRCQSNDPQVMFNNARKEVGFMRLLIQHLDTNTVDGIV